MTMLGVGQCQMVEICKAVNASAKLIIMDEPTASLSEKKPESCFESLKSYVKRMSQ